MLPLLVTAIVDLPAGCAVPASRWASLKGFLLGSGDEAFCELACETRAVSSYLSWPLIALSFSDACLELP